jgi:hypothetical protein
MKYIVGLAALLLCSGCARSITFVYKPGVEDPSRFSALAERECDKYGQMSIFRGDGIADFGRSTKVYDCVQK